jgi:hypothetical protein
VIFTCRDGEQCARKSDLTKADPSSEILAQALIAALSSSIVEMPFTGEFGLPKFGITINL